jgi:hypothetical protein
LVSVAQFFIQLQIYLSFALFIFAQPLEIDRSSLFSSDIQILKDAPEKIAQSINSKLKLILKPKIDFLEIREEKLLFFQLPQLHSIDTISDIFRPPIS